MPVRQLAAATSAALVLAGAGTAVASPCPVCAAHVAPRQLGERRIDARLIELTLRSDAVSSPTRVRVLLPAGYGASPRRRYPVLYLLHGALNDQAAWTQQGDAEQLTAPYGVIVVMPDSGTSGGYVDWYNNGHGGPPRWETYHINQLLPFIDRRFRTVARRTGRAIAGLSMGGFGAMSYAARHPDLFAAAASFSGAVDTNNRLDIAVTPVDAFGPRATQEVRWRGHNPWDLAGNLKGMRLILRTGDGQPGGPFGGGDVVEQVVHQMNVSFHQRLQRLGVAHLWDDYGPGGHLWAYWQRDLRRTLPELMDVFSRPRGRPALTTFTAVERRYAVDGWRVALRRRQPAFSTLIDAGRRGFALRGSGTATVTTPPRLLAPGRWHAITVTGAARRTAVLWRRADRRGRLTVAFDLGAATRRATVRIAAASAGPARPRSATIG